MTYPWLSQSTFSVPGYPGLSGLAQGVVFPDDLFEQQQCRFLSNL